MSLPPPPPAPPPPKIRERLRAAVKPIPFGLGLAIFAALMLLDSPLQHFGAMGARPAHAAAVTALMAFWWLTEALPIQITACVPLVFFPFLGVFSADALDNTLATAKPYVDPYIFLFLGGMCIAAAMQHWNLHSRIAVRIMALIGTDPRRLLLGVLCGSGFISLWISNTATAAMMVPIALAIVHELEARAGRRRLEAYGGAIMLAVAYGANIGGIGTKIGTAPNAQFSQFMAQSVGVDVTFLRFMAVGMPFVIMFIPLAWLVLWRAGRADAPSADVGAAVVADEVRRLGPMHRGERIVAAVFVCTALLWILGKPIHTALTPFFTDQHASGLSPYGPDFKLLPAHVEGGVAMLAALVLLLWRVDGGPALPIRALRLVPWDTLLLLGGAFSMAQGVQQSGLSDYMGTQLRGLSSLGGLSQVLVASLATVGLTSVASNTATLGVMLNVLKDAVSPVHLNTVLFAATISASLDFALPAGTPPNAIVFGTGYLTVARMVKVGVVLDLAGGLLAAFWCALVVPWVLG